MRIAIALVLPFAVAAGCSPVLATYVAPSNATNVRSSNPSDANIAQAYAVAYNGAPAVALVADLPMARRTVTFTCPDGADVSRELVSDTQDTFRGVGGAFMFVAGSSAAAVSLLDYVQNTSDRSQLYPALTASLVALLGLTAMTFGWHPPPHTLIDGSACAGHEAPAISQPSSTTNDG